MLRRHLQKLVVCLEGIEGLNNVTSSNTNTSTNSRSVAPMNWDERKERKTVLEERIWAEAEFLVDVLAPRAYVAFATLVADGQYAPIGLMAVGVLAEVVAILGTGVGKKAGDIGVGGKVEGEGSKMGEPGVDLGERIERVVVAGSDEVGGLGKEKKRREIIDDDEEVMGSGKKAKVVKGEGGEVGRMAGSEGQGSPALMPKLKEKTKKKKKKKGGDALDDLFSGLF